LARIGKEKKEKKEERERERKATFLAELSALSIIIFDLYRRRRYPVFHCYC
jgi:hypothetical protein